MLYKFDKATLTYRKVTGKAVFIALGLILVSSLIVGLMNMNKLNTIKFISQETKNIIIKEHNEFTKERLKEYIKELNIRYPDIVYAQAVIESGNFSSSIFYENNNLFGMRCAKLRPTTCKDENNGFAVYEDWRASVLDYALLQSTLGIRNEDQYLQYLTQTYAQDTLYMQKIKKIIKSPQ
jgi:flagellum-specific peptidoglycan hydrolase FlgJ